MSRPIESTVYNVLRMRGYPVDVGVVGRRATVEGKSVREQLEADFVANLGSNRIYLQSAYQMPTPEKVAQGKASLYGIDGSFKKIVLVRDVLTMSVYDFLLHADSLSW